ncbi:MAG TPA: pseudouridine-5'-phosphate glycosidase [bacterium]|nr:pseudouridine-5'-phosphate glycosidase [bacterium]
MNAHIDVLPEVTRALAAGRPVVALESAVLSHGVPVDAAGGLAARLDKAVRAHGATPALVAMRNGRIEVGASHTDIAHLLDRSALKVAERDLAVAVAQGRSGGTTVAATLAVAVRAGIAVMSTGGIGGVHLDAPEDVSADLYALSRHSVVVVCAGAKIICDQERTIEALDTLGVTAIGYQTDTYPAFIVRSSGIPMTHRAETAAQVAAIARARLALGAAGALLVVQPPPAEVALERETVDAALAEALQRARTAQIRGPALTPFLLTALADATGGRSLVANLRLLESNAALAAEIATALAADPRGGTRRGRPDLSARRERRTAKGSGRP